MKQKFLDPQQVGRYENEGAMVVRQAHDDAFVVVKSDQPEDELMKIEPVDPFLAELITGKLSQPELDVELLVAAQYGETDRVRQLLSEGANPKAEDSDPLRMAASNGHTESVRLLIGCSDVNAGNGEALREAAKNGYAEIVDLLIRSGANVHAENDEALKLARKHTIATPGSFGAARRTPKGGHAECIKVLRAAGARLAP